MASYAQIADVLYPFPRFQQALPNNVSNGAIQAWLDEGKAEIRARFLRRGIDPDSPATLGWNPPLVILTDDQANVLRKFNTAYGIVQFGDAIFGQLSEGEVRIVTRATEIWTSMGMGTDGSAGAGKYILGNSGVFDALFTPNATHVRVGPQFGGYAGADFNPSFVNNETLGTHFMFEKNQRF